MPGWGAFYSVIAAAAATLLGLLFVAVSINAAETFSSDEGHVRRLSEQAFRNYLNVVLVALLALFPDISPSNLGVATIGLTGVASIWSIVRVFQSIILGRDRRAKMQAFRRHALSILGFALLLYAASRMALKDSTHEDTFASGLIILLGSATVVSWELLVGIAMTKKIETEVKTKTLVDGSDQGSS